MVNYPEFNLNEPFTLMGMEETAADGQERQALLNKCGEIPVSAIPMSPAQHLRSSRRQPCLRKTS